MIDDPLLRPRYGFVQYEKLLRDMETHNYAVNVSHVPKNSSMTKKVTAKLFAENPERFSVSVHGCDHIRGEFSTEDDEVLNKLTATSLSLMAEHEKQSGVLWDRVMVFPHGRFSVASLKVLKDHGVMGAVVSVNAIDSSNNPTGSREVTFHKLAEFMKPVVTAYGGVPLFLRRYPECIEEFAFDLLLGRPLIITTHHQDFRDNVKVNQFVDRLNKMEPNLKWMSLAEIIKECIVEKSGEWQVAGGEWQVASGGVDRVGGFFCVVKRNLMILRDNLMAWKEYLG